MREPTIANLRHRLLKQRGRYRQIAEHGGLTYSWVSKFAVGERGHHPSYDLIQRLIAALDAIEAEAPSVARRKPLAKPRRKAPARRPAKEQAP